MNIFFIWRMLVWTYAFSYCGVWSVVYMCVCGRILEKDVSYNGKTKDCWCSKPVILRIKYTTFTICCLCSQCCDDVKTCEGGHSHWVCVTRSRAGAGPQIPVNQICGPGGWFWGTGSASGPANEAQYCNCSKCGSEGLPLVRVGASRGWLLPLRNILEMLMPFDRHRLTVP